MFGQNIVWQKHSQIHHTAFPGSAFFFIGAALSWETVVQKLLATEYDRAKIFKNNKHFCLNEIVL